jgi:hypothetical protein
MEFEKPVILLTGMFSYVFILSRSLSKRHAVFAGLL